MLPTDHSDNFRTSFFNYREDLNKLVSFSAVADYKDNIVLCDHS